ncbi:MAG: type II secretion system protein N [Sphingobium sp.]
MMGLILSRRAKLGLLLVLFLALVAFFPLRLAMGMLRLDRYAISARSVHGSLWWGQAAQLNVGDVSLGTVSAGLSPVQLLVGRARLDIWRKVGAPDDIEGALTAGFNRVGLDDVTGTVPMGAVLAPMPISAIAFTDVSAYFAGAECGHAEGRIKAFVSGDLPGLNLSQGLTGDVRCDGKAILLPLVSQSGLEKLNLRIGADGHYTAEMLVQSSDPALEQGLGAAGFGKDANGYALRIDGSL